MSALKYYDGSSWVTVGATAGNALAYVNGPRTINTAALTSSTGAMIGLGINLTPTATGKVLVTFAAAMQCNLASGQGAYAIWYGTGTKPTFNAAPTGTGTLPSAYCTFNFALQVCAASVTVLIPGLTVGTAYWFDLAVNNNAQTNSIILFNVTGHAIELP